MDMEVRGNCILGMGVFLLCACKCVLGQCICMWVFAQAERSAYISVFVYPQSSEQRLLVAQIKTGVNSFSLTLCVCVCICICGLYVCVCTFFFAFVFLGARACLCVCLCVQAVVHACCAVMLACLTGHIRFKIHIQHFALFFFFSPLFAALSSFSPF